MPGRMLGTTVVAAAVALITGGSAVAETLRVGGNGAAQGILQLLGEAFIASHPDDKVEMVPGLGSSGGISAVIDGELQLAVSGRLLKPQERDQGAKSLPLLKTPFVFVTSHPAAQKLTTTAVIEIFDGTLTKWPDGSAIKPILRPRSDSASEYLVANLPGMQSAMEVLRKRPDVPMAATDQDNAEMAEKVRGSLTAMTLVQFLTERPRLHAIELDGVEPSLENMRNGRYKLIVGLELVQGPHTSAVADRFIAFLATPEAVKIVGLHGSAALTAPGVASQ